MSLCKQCVSGVRHEGETKGKVEKINGVDSYIAIPEMEYPKDKALLLLTDIFGIQLKNALLLADDFALNGFHVVAPDLFNGGSAEPNALSPGSNFDLHGFLGKHKVDDVLAIIKKVIAGLEEKGITVFGATGYCFGGKFVSLLAQEGKIKAGVMNHPSLLDFPSEFETIKKANVPILWNTAEDDFQMNQEYQADADRIFKDDPNYKRNFYPGTQHGFAVRGDLSQEKIKFAKENSFKESVQWLQKHV
ncbi:alpha/beta-hydrolase [Atractiella rhizophila]|nr:alpha/beta-hydrolase [Atractiella rhizophila]